MNFNIDYVMNLRYKIRSLAHRGASSGDVPEGGARTWRLAAAARNRSSREARDPARQALRLGCEELRCTDREEMPEKEARTPAQNRHGGAPRGARPASWDARHPAGCLTRYVIARPTGAAAPVRLSAHRPPLVGVGNTIKARARTRRGNETCCSHGLFDIVRREYEGRDHSPCAG